MIYLDMFFLFLGTPMMPPQQPGEPPVFVTEYFYLTKNMQVK